MEQRVKVTGKDGRYAIISVSRSTMCEGCHKEDGCGGHCELSGIMGDNKTVEARAVNEVGAAVGDTVEVETESRTVLFYAGLVFLAPILMAVMFYSIANGMFASDGISVGAAAAGFALTFLGIALYDRKKKTQAPTIRIVRICQRGETRKEME